jgi:hypothetical protein
LKGSTAKPEEATFARQWLCKYVPAAKDNHRTTEELLEAKLSMQSLLRLHNENSRQISLMPLTGLL